MARTAHFAPSTLMFGLALNMMDIFLRTGSKCDTRCWWILQLWLLMEFLLSQEKVVYYSYVYFCLFMLYGPFISHPLGYLSRMGSRWARTAWWASTWSGRVSRRWTRPKHSLSSRCRCLDRRTFQLRLRDSRCCRGQNVAVIFATTPRLWDWRTSLSRGG